MINHSPLFGQSKSKSGSLSKSKKNDFDPDSDFDFEKPNPRICDGSGQQKKLFAPLGPGTRPGGILPGKRGFSSLD
jgi:hypothetical protein